MKNKHTEADTLLEEARIMLQKVDKSPIFQGNSSSKRVIPTFASEEIESGEVLGVGTCGVVREIVNISAKESIMECRRGRRARYAIKALGAETGLTELEKARRRIDLAIEIKYLKALDHPNIIRLRGLCGTNDSIDQKNFFVMDRLYGTLEDSIEEWKKLKQSSKGGLLQRQKQDVIDDLTSERLVVAFDLSSALSYMHKKQVIHRDIKPENIGFDVRHDVKIFDFGLAKSLNPDLHARNGLYRLTARTGSFPYMAPEVAKKELYNEKCDVFSLGMVLYEMMSFKKPFPYLKTRREYYEKISVAGSRPTFSRGMCSSKVQNLIKASWNQLSTKRPSMEQICSRLKEELDEDIEEHTATLLNRSGRSLQG